MPPTGAPKKSTAKKAKTATQDQTLAEQLENFDGVTIGKKKYGPNWVIGALVLLGVLATPLGFAAKWAFDSITDQDKYVALVSGLANEPDIQDAVAHEVTTRVLGLVDVSGGEGKGGLLGKLNDLVGSVTGKDVNQHIEAVVGPPLNNAVTNVVNSDQFQGIWTSANQSAHTALLAALENDTEGVAGISNTGDVTMDVSGLLSEAIDEDSSLAFLTDRVENMNLSVPLVEKEQVDSIRTYFDMASSISTWAPILGGLCLLVALVLAKKRMWVGVAIGATFMIAAFLPAIIEIYLNVSQPAALAGEALTAQVSRHIVDEAVANSGSALGSFIPIGIAVIVISVILGLIFPKFRDSRKA